MNIRGMTLLEIIVVVSIVSILLVITILNGTIVLRTKERNELKEFKNDIIYARDRSIIESKSYYIDINPNKNMYLIRTSGKTLGHIIKRKELCEGIKIKNTNIMGNEVAFNALGRPNSAGTIYMEDSKGQKIEITISPATGRINIYFD